MSKRFGSTRRWSKRNQPARILDKVDEQVMRHKQLITTYATIGRLIRGTFELKKRIEATITSQIHSVVNIARRLKTASSIWKQQAGPRRFFYGIRSVEADAHLANLERLAKLDSELERMLFDRENILLDLAKLYRGARRSRMRPERSPRTLPQIRTGFNPSSTKCSRSICVSQQSKASCENLKPRYRRSLLPMA